MVAIARAWRELLDGGRDPDGARDAILGAADFAPPSNGYYYGRPGAELAARELA